MTLEEQKAAGRLCVQCTSYDQGGCERGERSLVTGRPPPAQTVRYDPHACGPAGAWFDPISTPEALAGIRALATAYAMKGGEVVGVGHDAVGGMSWLMFPVWLASGSSGRDVRFR